MCILSEFLVICLWSIAKYLGHLFLHNNHSCLGQQNQSGKICDDIIDDVCRIFYFHLFIFLVILYRI